MCLNYLLLYIHHFVFFFNDTSTTKIYTLSLHDALPIFYNWTTGSADDYLNTKWTAVYEGVFRSNATLRDRKSTRLNSSHTVISYAVFCLKKKNQIDPVLFR